MENVEKQIVRIIENNSPELAAEEILRLLGVVEQLKAFADYAQKRMWEDGDKDLSEFVNEFLRL